MRATNLADSLSQYSKHSNEGDGQGSDNDAKSKLSGIIITNKKTDKFIKT